MPCQPKTIVDVQTDTMWLIIIRKRLLNHKCQIPSMFRCKHDKIIT
jgi:hypothetical protein